ncbi:MAG: hypothetical protein K0Q70_2160 [Rhodospirillales bacterium]|jgi:uncharacterized OB-fold protein|nr:hypothetical protein [Rhodospirillales bacterium]
MIRPVAPVPNFETQEFWDGCRRGQLLLQKCGGCGAYRHPPAPICPACLSPQREWVEASGHGTIYTFVVVRETRAKGWEQMVPYVTAVVTLEEGPRVLTNIVDVAPEDVKIDMPVQVIFAEAEGEMKLPLFRPVQ